MKHQKNDGFSEEITAMPIKKMKDWSLLEIGEPSERIKRFGRI